MHRFHTTIRLALLLLLIAATAGCDIGSTLEPETPEAAPRPPRIVRPKELTVVGTIASQPVR